MGRIRFPKMLRDPHNNPLDPPNWKTHYSPAGVFSIHFASFFSVLSVAILLRLGSCGESFWLDELHSLWTIQDGPPHLFVRATAGNQSPLYYWILWGWERAGSYLLQERVADVLPRVLSVALSTIPLLVFFRLGERASRKFIAGFIASIVYVLDINAIFFGSEVRCYILVMALSAILFGIVWQIHARPQTRMHWPLMIVSLLLGITHYTAIIACAWLLLASTVWFFIQLKYQNCRLDAQNTTHWSLRDSLWGLSGLIIAVLSQWRTLLDLFSRRDLWRGIGQPHTWRDIENVYPWLTQCLFPLVALGCLLVVRRVRKTKSEFDENRSSEKFFGRTLWLGSTALSFLFVVWLLSYFGLLPLWQTRYLISVLPWLYWFSALLWNQVYQINLKPRPNGRWIAMVVILLAGIGLTIEQGTWTTLASGSFRLVNRGEDWRGAVAFIRDHVQHGDQVCVAQELLETEHMQTDDALQRYDEAYLCFAVRGPYTLHDAKPIADFDLWVQSIAPDAVYRSKDQWILVRKPVSALQSWCNRLRHQSNLPVTAHLSDFGSVSVIQLQTR